MIDTEMMLLSLFILTWPIGGWVGIALYWTDDFDLELPDAIMVFILGSILGHLALGGYIIKSFNLNMGGIVLMKKRKK